MLSTLHSLSAKIIVPVALALLLVLGAVGYFERKEKETSVTDSLIDHAETLNVVLEATLRHAMMKSDRDALDNMIVHLSQVPVIKRVYILNAQGKVALSSDKTMINTTESNADIEGARKNRQGTFALKTSSESKPYIAGLSPLVAENGCTTCHSDVKEGDPVGYIGLERWATHDFDTLRSSQATSMWMSIGTVVLLCIILSLITRAITKPLGIVSLAASKIAVGDLDQNIVHQSKDELGTLAQSFRGLIGYIKRTAQAAEALSRGNTHSEVTALSEHDVLSRSFQNLQTTLQELTEETGRLTQWAREGQLDKRGDEQKFQGAFRDLIAGMNTTLNAVAAPINESSAALQRVAERDLSIRMHGNYPGKYATIQQALNTATQNLDQALAQVATASEEVASASGQISTGGQSLARAASEQASSLQEISSALHEMAAKAQQNTDNATEARSLSGNVQATAERGSANMHSLSQAMTKIKASADSTARIVKTIEEIAFQTNLLALNAAVEAARAGDAGRGFAVVAEEVRNLAIRSAEAAKNTSQLIKESVMNAEEGVVINRQVLKDLDEINTQVRTVTQVMAEIAVASEQQSRGVKQINGAVEQMNQGVQGTAANAEESASAAAQLSAQSEALQNMVNSFHLSAVQAQDSIRTSQQRAMEDLDFFPPSFESEKVRSGLHA